jgi:beta-mannosidase
MACNFGWDWGPALPTSGIWKPMRLEAWNSARITSVRPEVRLLNHDRAEMIVHVNADGSSTCGRHVQLFLPGHGHVAFGEAKSADGSSLLLEIDHPRYWSPRGHGSQTQYRLCVTLFDPEEGPLTNALDEAEVFIGLRTVELDGAPDEIGRKFVIKVNGKPIFCKGFNWIPDDCFLDRACDSARVRQRIQQAIDTGANMLRVWGGGIYETDDFYNICDELGVMVWQDFPFACAMYPEEEPFGGEVEAEARDNVARLASHPSLTIWNGCNENLWGYRDWGWKDDPNIKAGASWGKGYYFDLLPKVVSELTPGIPYWAGSPWSGDYDVDNGVPPNADTHGNMHCWAPWFREDYSAYRKFQPRFSSEFGFQAPATYASIASVVPENQRDFGSLEMRHRQKSGNPASDDGDKRNLRHLLKHFNIAGVQELLDSLDAPDPKPTPPLCGSAPLLPARTLPSRANFDDLHYLLQVNQARALTLGVEWMRSRWPRCMGTLYWQLNDCWPGVTSWSCIDGDGRPKPLWYATRRFYAPRLLTIQPSDPATYKLGEHLTLFAINDTDEPWDAAVQIRCLNFVTGGKRQGGRAHHIVPPRSVGEFQLYGEPFGNPRDPQRELIVCDVDEHRAFWFFAADKDLSFPKPQFDAEWNDGRLTIRAKSLLRDVCIFVDRLNLADTVSDQLVTLLPGESFTFEITSSRELTKEQLTTPPVFRCVNSFGAS